MNDCRRNRIQMPDRGGNNDTDFEGNMKLMLIGQGYCTRQCQGEYGINADKIWYGKKRTRILVK
jgi:hypothetical protein